MHENENEKVVSEETQEQQPSDIDLAMEIQKIRQESISKEEYEKLKKEKNDLLKKIINGERIESGASVDNKKTIQEYREKLMSPDLTNLEYVETALGLREAVLEEQGVDVFADANGEHADSAQRVAETLKECVEQADGDDAVFTSLLQGRIANDPVKPNKKSR